MTTRPDTHPHTLTRTFSRAALLALALTAVWRPASPALSKPRIVLAWTGSPAVKSAPGVAVVSPTWWTLNTDSSLRDTSTASAGHVLWPIFANRTDAAASHAAMADATKRAALIRAVRDSAVRAGARGVNIDWENLADADRDLFSAFVREATADWHRAGLTVSVDVTAITDNWALGNWSTSFDRRALGETADYVVLMAYDQYNRLRPGGPTASLPWVRDSIQTLLKDVPAAKILLGIPFYTRDWSDDPARPMETLTIAQTPARLAKFQAQTTWDEATGTTYATYNRDGFAHRIWVEDERSLALKTTLVDEYDLAGSAVWRIGFGTDTAWRVITGSGPVPGTRTTPAPSPAPVAAEASTPPPSSTRAPAAPRPAAAPAPTRSHTARSTVVAGAAIVLALGAAAALATSRTKRS